MVLLKIQNNNSLYLCISEPCTTYRFEGMALKFQQDPYDIWFPYHPYETKESNNDTDNSNVTTTETPPAMIIRMFHVYFTTADEIIYSSSQLVDLANFISSVGGNLGLFLGFSFMGILFSCYEWIRRVLIRSTARKANFSNTVV